MATNFDYFQKEPQFKTFVDVAVSAEKIILLDAEACIINCRRAMEFAVKWMYSVDTELEMPYQDNLQSLMNAEDYRNIVGNDLWKRMDYIRRCGNIVAHGGKKLGRDEALLCLENLFVLFDFIGYCYSEFYEEHSFDRKLILARQEKAKQLQNDFAKTKETLALHQQELVQKELDLKRNIRSVVFSQLLVRKIRIKEFTLESYGKEKLRNTKMF